MRKRLLIAAALVSILTVSVFADDVIWDNTDNGTSVEEVAFEDVETEELAGEDSAYVEEVFDGLEEYTEEYSEETEEVFTEEAYSEDASAVEVYVEETYSVETYSEEAYAEEVYAEEETASEQIVFEEEVSVELTAADEYSANEVTAEGGLVYTGEPQELITAREGEWLYSLDAETFNQEIPTAINAGEYTVYIKSMDGDEVETVKVAIAKADVTFTPPIPNTTK
jgi:hypothetical protein